MGWDATNGNFMGWLTSLYCFMHVGRSVDKLTFADRHSRIIPGHPASHHQSIHQVVVNKLLGLSHIESHCAAGRGSFVSSARYESFIGPTVRPLWDDNATADDDPLELSSVEPAIHAHWGWDTCAGGGGINK